MSQVVYQYRVYCTTEAAYVTVWNTEQPSVCPNVNTHTIDSNSWTIIDRVEETAVKVVEEATPTGGNYLATTKGFDITAGVGVVSESSFSFPYNINVITTSFHTMENQNGDTFEFIGNENTILGTITSDVTVSDTVISVSSTVIDNIVKGWFVNLFDGSNTSNLGRVLEIDNVTNQITVETAADNNFATATPTFVRISVKFAHEFEICGPRIYTTGASNVGARFVPANSVITIRYTNSTAEAKRFVVYFELFY